MNTYRIEIAAPGATTFNFTIVAPNREAAIAAARNMGVEPLTVALD